MDHTKSVWWMGLVSGTLLVLLGWLLLAKPATTVISLVVFLGFYLLVAGIVEVVMSFFGIGKEDSHWGLVLLGGIVSVIAGLVVLNNTLFTSVLTPVMFAYVAAFAILVSGAVRMFAGKKVGDAGNYVWTWGGFFLGLLYVVFGLYLLAAPTAYTVAVMVRATGWFTVVIGGLSIAYAFVERSEEKKLA